LQINEIELLPLEPIDIDKIKCTTPRIGPHCPNCGNMLGYLMPDGHVLHCDECKKYYNNDHGKVGPECGSPYTRKDVDY
jgi:hypothetical protein